MLLTTLVDSLGESNSQQDLSEFEPFESTKIQI